MKVHVGISGSTGGIYALRFVPALCRNGVDVSVTLSRPACRVLADELDIAVSVSNPDLSKLFGECATRLQYYHIDDIGAPPATGSSGYDVGVVIPCSMGTLGRIAHGTSEDLISRAADVFLKERRKLVLVVREAPYSVIHLENMLAVARAGGTIMPASPGFYTKPQTLDDLVDFVVDRTLMQLGYRLAAPG